MGCQVQTKSPTGHAAQCGAQIAALVGLAKDGAECWLWMCEEHRMRTHGLFAKLPVIGEEPVPIKPGEVFGSDGVALQCVSVNEVWTTFEVAGVQPCREFPLKKGDRVQAKTLEVLAWFQRGIEMKDLEVRAETYA